MLQEIAIKNFAIIEAIRLTFDKGMTVLTGETGAGKSIIIDAMNMMLGSRASHDVVRHGQLKAEIEGLFSVNYSSSLTQLLTDNGIDPTEELIIRREISANGRSVSRVNGQLVNLSTLKAIGEHLVDIHGQHDQEELMRPQHHIRLLDSFGEQAFWNLKKAYQASFDSYRKKRKHLLTIKKNQQEHRERIEMLEFQLAELEAAELKSGEDQDLLAERERLLNHKTIADTLVNVYALLDNEDFSSLSNIRSAMNDLQTIEDYDATYQEFSQQLTESYYGLEEITRRLGATIDDLEFDGERLMMVENRLDVIHSMTKKYGGTVDDVLIYFEQISKEYALLTGDDFSFEDLEKELKIIERDLVNQVKELSTARHQLAEQLEEDIHQELKDLYMEKARFQVRFTSSKFSCEGNETVEFYISTNPGEEFKPLVKVASGGELSRLMLAVKSAFARREDKTAIVFDEVDTGVSGRVGQAIAQKIYKIGNHGQILAISHLPQVIAIADYQFFIQKQSDEKSTVSTVRLLTTDERVEEIAKMLAGENVTETARQQARELLGI
ncbi:MULTISPECIES: DNA repair protein RecN [unclassified Streptococcus]|uniref:DNA repair protein RecN n=1 Tax=unclassified Streptococcus TaxID=2608887 RepID=UPI00359D0A4F